MDKGNSFSNGPAAGHSAYNGCGPVAVRHGEQCTCIWCLQGHK